MSRRKILHPALAVLAALALLAGCARPTRDPGQLRAIKAEARMLMRAYPADADESLSKAQFPPAIARLQPDLVLVEPDGVHILIKGYFDGGRGYFVPRKAGDLPRPAARLEELGQGVYWWHPS